MNADRLSSIKINTKYRSIILHGIGSDGEKVLCEVCCKIGHQSETHPKPKSLETSFAHDVLRGYRIVLKFCTEHGSNIAVLCAKLQNDSTTRVGVMEERDLARFEFKCISGGHPMLLPPLAGRRFNI